MEDQQWQKFYDQNINEITNVTLILITMFVLYGCGQHQKPTAETQMQCSVTIDSASKTKKLEQDERFEKKKTVLQIPDGVYLDSITSYDSSKALTIQIRLPKSKDKQLTSANNLLTKIITNKKNEFLKDGVNEFSVCPEVLYKDKNVLSYLLQIEVNWADAAHSTSYYYAFNYDINKQKEIDFFDFFSLKKKADRTSLLNLINTAFGNAQYLRVPIFYPFDFSFDNRKVSFNFDQSEIGASAYGLQQATIDRKELGKYINSEYRQ